MQTVTNKVKTIMKYKYYHGKVKYFGEISALDDLFDFVEEYLKEPTQIFLDSLHEIEATVLRKYKDAQLLNIKTTIGDFNNFFEQLSEINEFAKVILSYNKKFLISYILKLFSDRLGNNNQTYFSKCRYSNYG